MSEPTAALMPPASTDPSEVARTQHSRRRRCILYGMHEPIVRASLLEAIGTTRTTAVRIVDMTANPAWYVCSQLSALYRELPEVDPPEGAEDTAAAVLEAGWWQLAQRVQRDTVGLNDLLVKVDLDPGTKDPAFRIAYPDLVEVVASPIRPMQPLAVKEWIQDPDDIAKWVRLVCDPRARLYMALDSRGADVTERVLGGPSFSGENYPYIVNGKPVLPYVAYHKVESGFAWDPYTGREVFDGAVQLGMYYSFFGHTLRQASWMQRYALGARPKGGDVDATGRRKDIVADPATVAFFEADDEGGGAAVIGQWQAPVDPDKFYSAIERYERRLVEAALSTVGVSRRESDVRSAASLAVSREAQRDAQRAFEPTFRRSDLRLLGLVAGLRGEPTEGWRIQYRSLPRDAVELAAELERMQGLIAAGLLDKVTAYQQLHPGLTRTEAEAAIREIAKMNRELGAAPEPARPPPPAP